MLNQTATYAIRAMGYLAAHDQDGPILSSTIAADMAIPRNFLSKILNRLTQAGLITTIRGRGGGAQLSRPGSEIRLYEVVELFMRLEDLKRCFIGMPNCNGGCGLHRRWRTISEQVETLLNNTTVDQVL